MTPLLREMHDAHITQADARAYAKRAHELARLSQALWALCQVEMSAVKRKEKASALLAKFAEQEAL